MGVPLTVPARTRQAFDRLAADLTRVFGARLVALVASGPRSSVAFTSSVATGDLEALGMLFHHWHHDGLDTPLLLTPEEFARSIDAFPVEYQALIDSHLVIAGRPPFDAVTIAPELLRRACEVQAKSHLIHLRQGWIEAAGHEADLAALVAGSAPALRALLSDVARLHGAAAAAGRDAAQEGARLASLDQDLARDILALEHAPGNGPQLVPRLSDYLQLSERLWTFVDTWPS